MIHKQIIGKELYVYMNGKLLYKRWLTQNKGIVFCPTFGAFKASDVEQFNQSIK
jgi:hypothetical protein